MLIEASSTGPVEEGHAVPFGGRRRRDVGSGKLLPVRHLSRLRLRFARSQSRGFESGDPVHGGSKTGAGIHLPITILSSDSSPTPVYRSIRKPRIDPHVGPPQQGPGPQLGFTGGKGDVDR